MEAFSVNRIQALLPKLPPPVATYAIPGVVFETYRAKGFSAYWHDPALRTLVLWARDSYSRYGIRSALDQYDAKAAIYLVRAQYPSASDRHDSVGEWLSIRMIPGGGDPIGVGELELYWYQGRRLDAWLQASVRQPAGSFWDSIVSSSRMCGIHPYTREAELSSGGSKHRYTAASFALIHAQFVLDYPPEVFPFEYVTAIIRSELVERGLTLWKDGEARGPVFLPAHRLLGLSDKSGITLCRSAYAYEFPRYWLDMPKLIRLLEGLVCDGRLSETTIQHYIEASLRSEEGERQLGRLLMVEGPIAGAALTGAELRGLVDAQVADIPELKITPAAEWHRGIVRMAEAAGLDLVRDHPQLQQFL
ncbi:hypothetical protein HYW67_03880 [Candidatus Parcubacteria bacterium]|nr:hypothetical protein [Candidatus Parcubacteria bacterium]